MKFLASSMVMVWSLLAGATVFAAPSADMNVELDRYESYIRASKNNYKLEEQFPSAQIKFLKEWPVEVQRSTYLKIWETNEAPLLIDPADLANYQRSFDIEVSYSASILRSVEVTVGAEKAYVAIYLVWGGQWGRESNFLEYYIFNAGGELLRLGNSRD